MDAKLVSKLTKVYCSLQKYWKVIAAIKKLAAATDVSKDATKRWLVEQAL